MPAMSNEEDMMLAEIKQMATKAARERKNINYVYKDDPTAEFLQLSTLILLLKITDFTKELVEHRT